MAGLGGARPGAGRKSKAEERKLRDKLIPFEESALRELKKGIEAGKFEYIKLYFEYAFGKPKEHIELDHSGEINTISLDASKLSDGEIRALLNARGSQNP